MAAPGFLTPSEFIKTTFNHHCAQYVFNMGMTLKTSIYLLALQCLTINKSFISQELPYVLWQQQKVE
jgi:hypothetical protein